MTPTPLPSSSSAKVSTLEVCAFRTRVHLGCSEEERAFAQEVEFDVQIQFAEQPGGTRTDRLEDTICYSSLCEVIESTAQAHPFQLIEALCYTTYEALRKLLPSPTVRFQVTVHKLRTPVQGLRGGARFTFGDPVT